jgi:hypothetical protein
VVYIIVHFSNFSIFILKGDEDDPNNVFYGRPSFGSSIPPYIQLHPEGWLIRRVLGVNNQ